MKYSEDISVSIFSGGRGTKNIFGALQGVPLNINFLINGYDSGLSTGRARWAFEGLLGPSDYRKTISTVLAYGTTADREVGRFLEDRNFLMKYIQSEKKERERMLIQSIPSVSYEQGKFLEDGLRIFQETEQVAENRLDIIDFSVGNALICSSFIQNNNNFNLALKEVSSKLLGISQAQIINVTDGADLWIVGVSGNKICVDEGFLVNHQPTQPIEEIFLVERSVVRELWGSHADWTKASPGLIESIRSAHQNPAISSEASDSLASSSLIVYGSGTLHSSLLPSYHTKDLTRVITQNQTARKIFFVNGERDLDFAPIEVQSALLTKTLDVLSANETKDVVTDIFISNIWPEDKSFEKLLLSAEFNEVNVLRASISSGVRYSESDAYSAFSSILSELSGHLLAASDSVISIVAPVYNEANLLPDFLRDFTPYVFQQNWACEKILVDGGSTDGSIQALNKNDAYTLLSVVEARCTGRFAAIHEGVLAARGKYVVVFHSDGEYAIANLNKLIDACLANPTALIIGSRTTQGYGASGLRKIYGQNKSLYWLSRVGGVLLATALTLRLGRPISDPFCGIFAGNRNLIHSITPKEGDINSQVQMLLRCRTIGIPIVEVSLDYAPRTKQNGKKTNFTMGLKALIAAITYRSEDIQIVNQG